MKKSVLSFKFLAFTLAAATFITSCQKEQLITSERQKAEMSQLTSSNSPNSSTVAQKTANDADKAFDKAVKQIMQNMMQQMNKMEMTCDPDIDFARMMIMHHDAGIQMADAELQYGHGEVNSLAIKTKQGNIASKQRLQAFLASHPNPEPLSKEQCKQFMKEMDETMKAMMMCMNKQPDTDDVDVDFANQMICHHQGAIAMSRVELKWGNDQAALDEAKTIIEEQSQEIIELSEFVNQHGIPSKH